MTCLDQREILLNPRVFATNIVKLHYVLPQCWLP